MPSCIHNVVKLAYRSSCDYNIVVRRWMVKIYCNKFLMQFNRHWIDCFCIIGLIQKTLIGGTT
jgi:hypothetical protein